MKIEELEKNIEKDCKINNDDLENEALKIISLHGKYIQFLSKEKVVLQIKSKKIRKLYIMLREYYLGQASTDIYKRKGPFNLKLQKNELDNYIKSDDEYQELEDSLKLSELKIELIEEMIKNLNKRNFSIKNYIELKKFSNGIL